jgi:uncharacterized protein YicC (UPF0701 family)
VSSTEAPISITVKSTAGSLITVRAETGNQLDNLVAEALESIKSAVMELESALGNYIITINRWWTQLSTRKDDSNPGNR